MNFQQTINHIRNWLINSTIDANYYYGRLLARIEIVPREDVPTACVSLTNKIQLGFNPTLLEELPFKQKVGVLKHELLHVCFGHLYNPIYYTNVDRNRMNIAMDLVINQFIPRDELPDWAIHIEYYPNFLNYQDTMTYYKLLENEEKKKEDSLLTHYWEINDEFLANILVKTLIQVTNEDLQQVGKNAENILKHILINSKAKPLLSLKKLILNSVNRDKKTELIIKRGYNKKYPLSEVTNKVEVKPKILFIVDESGSVSEEELLEFIAIIQAIKKDYDIELRAFDTDVGEPKTISNTEYVRTKTGGTDLNCVLDHYNKQKYYNMMFVLTDGYFSQTHIKCYKKYAIIISSNGTKTTTTNHKLVFQINQDIHI